MLARARRSLFVALLFSASLLCLSHHARAEVRLPSFISDNMVLQCDTPLKIKGWADPGEEVTVTLGTPGSSSVTGSAKADAQGIWLVKLPPRPASNDPVQMTVAGKKNTITLSNILIGEVWICSGQSNMEMDIRATGASKDDLPEADMAGIRLLNISIRKTISDKPETDLPLGEVDKQRPTWQVCDHKSVVRFSAASFYFGRELRRKLNVPVGLISASWSGSRIEPWIPWDVFHSDPALAAYPEMIQREAKELPQKLAAYEQALAQSNAVALDPNADPNGDPNAQPPTTTRPATRPAATVRLQKPQPVELRYGSMFNACLAPLTDYTIRGVLWYHGSANAGDAEAYRLMFPAMIRGWRKLWGQGDFPFYFVQLANYGQDKPQPNDLSGWSLIRDVQAETQKTPNTGMAVAIDIGEAKDLHPRNKVDVGKRLSLWALAKTYKQPGIVYSGPLYDSIRIEGNKAIISFKYVAEGLKIKGEKLTAFAIAGEDMKYVWADAVIDGQTVVVSSPQIPAPKSVRYGWSQNPECNLYNSADLPASPFRAGEPEALPVRKTRPAKSNAPNSNN